MKNSACCVRVLLVLKSFISQRKISQNWNKLNKFLAPFCNKATNLKILHKANNTQEFWQACTDVEGSLEEVMHLLRICCPIPHECTVCFSMRLPSLKPGTPKKLEWFQTKQKRVALVVVLMDTVCR